MRSPKPKLVAVVLTPKATALMRKRLASWPSLTPERYVEALVENDLDAVEHWEKRARDFAESLRRTYGGFSK